MTQPLAQATIKDVKQGGLAFTATFNPASLKVSLANKLQDEEAAPAGQKGGGKPHQNTRASTMKLETELIVDTSDTGIDVRADRQRGTDTLKKLAFAGDGDHPVAPKVEFRWGRFSFVGLIESINETLDFWSSEGIPLRSTVQLTIVGTGLDQVEAGDRAKTDSFKPSAIVKVPSGGRGTSAVAANSGNSGAGRALAAANGLESMRFEDGGALAVGESITLVAAARFELSGRGAGRSAGFGAGAQASAGVGISAGIGGGSGAGLGVSASAGLSTGASDAGFSARSSAGVQVGAGAFAGLGTSKTVGVSLPLDPAQLLPPPPMSPGLEVDVTGRAISSDPLGLSARLGASVQTTSFEERG